MQTDFTKDETIILLQEYYRRLEQKEVKVSIISKKDWDQYSDEVCVTKVTVIHEMEIVGMKKEVKEDLTREEVETRLRALFDLYDFELTSMSYNDGLNSKYEGYGMAEHEVKTPFCKGITVNLKKKQNKTLSKV